MNNIIFIESNTSGTGELFIKKSIDYGYKPIFVSANPELYNFLEKYSEVRIEKIDTGNKEKIIEFCNSLIKSGDIISAITSTSEYYIETVADIAQYFNLPGANPNAVKICRDKYLQYKTLREAGINVPDTIVVNKKEEITDILSTVNFPIVIKPVEGSGSVGVQLCDDYSTAFNAIDKLLSIKTNERGIEVDNRVLIQSFIFGKEYSAEVFDGKIIGITKKYLSNLPYFIETGHDFPANLNDNILLYIEREINKVIKSLNMVWGACHIEFKMFDNQLYLIEVNPRLAGGFIPQIVKYATEIDLIECQLKKASNLSININNKDKGRYGIRFIIPEGNGYINGFENNIVDDGILEVKRYKAINSEYKRYGDFRDRVGHIIFDMSKISSEKVLEYIKNINILEI